MPVVINGTTGITNVNGSAAAPAETGTDTDTGIYYGTNTVGLATNGTNALFVDASQNVSLTAGLAVAGNNISSVNSLGFRNRIINGAMVIDQRNAGASVTPASGAFTLDRWGVLTSQASKFSVQQNAGSVTPPTGFTNYLGITSLSAYSVTANDFFLLYQTIEGFNSSDFSWGTANAKTVTLSFWVRSSLTGTFGGVVANQYTTSGRYYPFTYTISAANTWEQKTVTIAGDTTGTWGSTNGNGVVLEFSLGVGTTYGITAGSWTGTYALGAASTTSVVGTNGATWYITGVQLEAGSVATPFERRDYGRELIMCQRYFETFALQDTFLVGNSTTTTTATAALLFKVTKRATPTITLPAAGQTSGTIGFLTSTGAYPAATGTNAAASISVDKATISGSSYTGLTAGGVSILYSVGSSTIQISAEL